MPSDESMLIQAQRLLAHAREVEQACVEFYVREAEREQLKQTQGDTGDGMSPPKEQPGQPTGDP